MALPIEGTARKHLKTVFKVSRTFEAFYTGGPIAVLPLTGLKVGRGDQDGADNNDDPGDLLVTALENEVCVTHTLTGQTLATLDTGGSDEPVTAIQVALSSDEGSNSPAWIVLATRQGVLHFYEANWDEIERSLTTSGKTVVDRHSLLLSSTARKKCFPLLRHIAKAHDSPIFALQSQTYSDEEGTATTLLASGSADGVVKVWDVVRGYSTHVLKGHGGVVSALTFLPPSHSGPKPSTHDHFWLASGADDARVIVWDLKSKASMGSLSEHLSVIRALDFNVDRNGNTTLLSASRDKIVNIWTYVSGGETAQTNGKGRSKKGQTRQAFHLTASIPVFEGLEGAGWLRKEECKNLKCGLAFWTAGEEGLLKLWNAQDGKCLSNHDRLQQASTGEEVNHSVVQAIYHPHRSNVLLAYGDQNISVVRLQDTTPTVTSRFIGFNDEIVDCVHLSPAETSWSCLALATNSSSIAVYDTSPGHFATTILEGHTGIVLSLARSSDGKTLVSGSKDKTARVWRWSGGTTLEWSCVAVLQGHTDSVSAVAISKKSPRGDFVVTGSQDRTIKVWDISGLQDVGDHMTISQPRSMATMIAHEKDINSIDVAPNDRLIVTGSQDRTAKLFTILIEGQQGSRSARLTNSGQFRGHKRGVWSARFSPTDQVIATSSGDKTIKIWSIHDYSCLKTFEGHTNSVLQAEFFNKGMQIVSSGSDGLVKLWAIRTEECVATLDNHTEKVWAVCVHPEKGTIVSVGADSVVNFWEDYTEADRQAREADEDRLIQEEQEYLNYIQVRDYRNAIRVAISLNQPYRLLKLFNESLSTKTDASTIDTAGIEESEGPYLGSLAIDRVIADLSGNQLLNLLVFVRNWNTNTKTSQVAQSVLKAILASHSPSQILDLGQLRHQQKAVRKAREQENLGPFAEDEGQVTTKPVQGVKSANAKSDQPAQADIREVIGALLPYTERHLTRAHRLIQDSYVIDWTLSSMDEILGQDSNVNGLKPDIMASS